MRTKILALGLVCLFVSLFLFSLQLDFAKFTPEDSAKYLEKHLKSLGYNFRVTTEMKEEKINILFDLKTPVKSDDDMEDFTWEIVTMTGDITSKTSWRSDKVIVFFKGKPFFWIYTKDCRKASKIVWGKMEFITAHLHYFKK